MILAPSSAYKPISFIRFAYLAVKSLLKHHANEPPILPIKIAVNAFIRNNMSLSEIGAIVLPFTSVSHVTCHRCGKGALKFLTKRQEVLQ